MFLHQNISLFGYKCVTLHEINVFGHSYPMTDYNADN